MRREPESRSWMMWMEDAVQESWSNGLVEICINRQRADLPNEVRQIARSAEDRRRAGEFCGQFPPHTPSFRAGRLSQALQLPRSSTHCLSVTLQRHGYAAEDFARKLLVDDRHARPILVVVPLERAKVRSLLEVVRRSCSPRFCCDSPSPLSGFVTWGIIHR